MIPKVSPELLTLVYAIRSVLRSLEELHVPASKFVINTVKISHFSCPHTYLKFSISFPSTEIDTCVVNTVCTTAKLSIMDCSTLRSGDRDRP